MPRTTEKAAGNRPVLILTAGEAGPFADAILRPAEPGQILRKAARDYRRKTTTPARVRRADR